MQTLFSSEIFNITCCSKIARANELMGNRTKVWHAWLIDLAIEHEGDGIELLTKYNYFPYVTVLSGLGSMGLASKAMLAGAISVFDKNPASIDQLHSSVCSTAALGFLLQGKPTQYLSVFSKLISKYIDSTDTWAEQACITNRQLERICKLHTSFTPRFFRPLYYTLWYALMNEFANETYPDEQSIHPFSYESSVSAIGFVEKNYADIIEFLL